MIKTLKQALEMREAHPDKVRITRETRWYVRIGDLMYELLPDRQTELMDHYIDELKAAKKLPLVD